MNGSDAQSSRGKSIWAVVAGLLVIIFLSTGVDAIMHAMGVFPPIGQPMSDGKYAWATAYRVIISIFGCYITARLAPNRPMMHALRLGVVGIFLSGIGAIATWNKGLDFGPHWYPVVLILVSIPCAWIGGKIYEKQGRR